MANADYIKLTTDTLADLPTEKQAEVYDFANYLKTTVGTKTRKPSKGKNTSILELIGIGASTDTDIALNHDRYLYE